jgi:hypothetical protein
MLLIDIYIKISLRVTKDENHTWKQIQGENTLLYVLSHFSIFDKLRKVDTRKYFLVKK